MKYTHIRVSVETLARLKGEIAKLVESVEAARSDCDAYSPDKINPNAAPISMDAFLNLLMDQRRKRNTKKPRKSRKPTTDG